MEELINVPLDKKTKKQLKDRANENGRAMSREAAHLIKDGLRKDASDGQRK